MLHTLLVSIFMASEEPPTVEISQKTVLQYTTEYEVLKYNIKALLDQQDLHVTIVSKFQMYLSETSIFWQSHERRAY